MALIEPDKFDEWQRFAWEESPFEVKLEKNREILRRAREDRDRLVKEVEGLRSRAGATSTVSPDDEDLSSDVWEEFSRLDAAGEFETPEDRQLATIDTIMPGMVINYLMLKKPPVSLDRIIQVLEAVKAREGWT